MAGGLSERYDSSNVRFQFCEDDYDDQVAQESDTNGSIFAIVGSGVRDGEHWSEKDLPSIDKIQAMALNVRLALGVVPLKGHEGSISDT